MSLLKLLLLIHTCSLLVVLSLLFPRYCAFVTFCLCVFLTLHTAMAPRKLCPFCYEEKAPQGFANHVKSCEKKLRERDGAQQYQQQLRDAAQAASASLILSLIFSVLIDVKFSCAIYSSLWLTFDATHCSPYFYACACTSTRRDTF